MAMAACYPMNYDMVQGGGVPHHPQQLASAHHRLAAAAAAAAATPLAPPAPQKDYSIPLHVDCSVEYELPNQAKPPVGGRVEPLLMIHPCYFRKMESQRRSPFINNMPNSSRAEVSKRTRSSASSSVVVSAQQQHAAVVNQQQQQQQQSQVVPPPPPANLQQQIDEYVQRQMAQMSQQAQYPVPTANGQFLHPTQTAAAHQPPGAGSWDRYIPKPSAQPPGAAVYAAKRAPVKRASSIMGAYDASQTAGAAAAPRWDVDKTSLAAVPRDYQASGPETTTAKHLYRPPAVVGKRDAMLSGGCGLYSTATAGQTAGNLWDGSAASGGIEKSPMAAIPRDYPAGPTDGKVVHGRYDDTRQLHPAVQQQQQAQHHHQAAVAQQQAQQQQQQQLQITAGKYRQYLRSHRVHPYMMATSGPVTSAAAAAAAFPQLTAVAAFPQMQQVSCFNV